VAVDNHRVWPELGEQRVQAGRQARRSDDVEQVVGARRPSGGGDTPSSANPSPVSSIDRRSDAGPSIVTS
jgi:hypothetical protein